VVAGTGTLGAERAACPSPVAEVGRSLRPEAPMEEGTAVATEGERQEGEATMLAVAAMEAMAVAAMAQAESTPEAGYLPAEPTSLAAKNGRTSAGPRRTGRTGSPAPAAPVAGRSPPAARRTPTLPTAVGRSPTLPPAAGVGRVPHSRSPSPAPPARISTAATRGRGSAAPRRRPDLPPTRQLSGPRRPSRTDPRGPRQRQGRLKIQADTSKWRRWRAPDHAANGRTADAKQPAVGSRARQDTNLRSGSTSS
jgi:hypothetical protein